MFLWSSGTHSDLLDKIEQKSTCGEETWSLQTYVGDIIIKLILHASLYFSLAICYVYEGKCTLPLKGIHPDSF